MRINNLITIKHKNFEATILKQGAQLLHFQPAGQEKFLWHTDLSHFVEGKPFRGGIPICWPWFGKAQFPAHGFARIMPWELVNRIDDEDAVTLEWRLKDTPKTREIWDHPFELSVWMRLGKSLKMRFSVDTDVETTGALHTYLYTNNLSDVTVDGLGESYTDALRENSLHVSSAKSLSVTCEVDRIYPSALDVSIMSEKERVIALHHQNFSDVVVWNPYKDLPDMTKDSYKKMLCIETARIAKPLKTKDFMSLTCKNK